MKIFEPDFRMLIFLIPALVSMIPLELFFIDSQWLQRIPIGGGNGIPYFDFLVFLSILFFARDLHANFTYSNALAVFFLFYCLVTFFFRSEVSFNYAVGLLLTHISVLLFFCGARYGIDTVVIDRFGLISCKVLIFYSFALILEHFLSIGTWSQFITHIDRFEGADYRTRWSVVRGVEKIFCCYCCAYSGWKIGRGGYFFSLVVLIVAVLLQLAESSRGGAIMALSTFFIGFFVSLRFQNKNRFKPFILVMFFLMLIVGMLGLLSNDTFLTLIGNLGEISEDDSIRARMSDAAVMLWSDNWVFGKGYIELFDRLEWSEFVLDNMRLPVHNLFVQYGLYIGFLGLFIYAYVFLVSFLRLVFLGGEVFLKSNEAHAFQFVFLFAILLGVFYMFLFQSMDRITLMFAWSMLGLFYGKR